MGPYGPHMGPYGPLWAHMDPKEKKEKQKKKRKNVKYFGQKSEERIQTIKKMLS